MDAAAWMQAATWIAIGICLSQSALFSGMNLAVFSISRLRLEIEVAAGNKNARKLLALRQNANLLLTTILWGNVGVNVLLALLSNSVMTGLVAFLFSTILITFIGEIIPQAYFSRHALQVAAKFSGLLRFYGFLLFPFAKPSAMILDMWLGQEGIHYFREKDLKQVIKMHMDAAESDVEAVEGAGALNFLALDDLIVTQEGEPVDPRSVVELALDDSGLLTFPAFERAPDHPFLRTIERSGKKWVILTDRQKIPQLVLDTDGFLRSALFRESPCNPFTFCHRPVLVTDTRLRLGQIMQQLKAPAQHPDDDVIDHDIILVWTEDMKRVITGADILGRLLRGIAVRAE